MHHDLAQSLLNSYRTYQNRDSELAEIMRRLESLLAIFRHLEDALSGHTDKKKEQNWVSTQNLGEHGRVC